MNCTRGTGRGTNGAQTPGYKETNSRALRTAHPTLATPHPTHPTLRLPKAAIGSAPLPILRVRSPPARAAASPDCLPVLYSASP